MKYLPFKTLILCILLPPLSYIMTVRLFEVYLTRAYTDKIQQIYIGDTKPLFNGTITLRESIHKNIDSYIKGKLLIAAGVRVEIAVTTGQGTLIYPSEYIVSDMFFIDKDLFAIASENYRLISEGLHLRVGVILPHFTLLSILILSSYILPALVILYRYHAAGMRHARLREEKTSKKIDRLLKSEQSAHQTLKHLEQERSSLLERLERIDAELVEERKKAMNVEDEMVDELVELEGKLDKNIKRQRMQQTEIERLKEEIEQYEKRYNKEGKRKTKLAESIGKRFKTLYKNVTVHERAVQGYINLADEMKLRSEEIIHQLNDDADKVVIKRKVFGKKNRKTVFEVIFGYKGRLYFTKSDQAAKIDVFVIGTKHSQNKDLTFLDTL